MFLFFLSYVNGKLAKYGTPVNLYDMSQYTVPYDGYVSILVNPKSVATTESIAITGSTYGPIRCNASNGYMESATGLVKKDNVLKISKTTGMEASSKCFYVPLH